MSDPVAITFAVAYHAVVIFVAHIFVRVLVEAGRLKEAKDDTDTLTRMLFMTAVITYIIKIILSGQLFGIKMLLEWLAMWFVFAVILIVAMFVRRIARKKSSENLPQ